MTPDHKTTCSMIYRKRYMLGVVDAKAKLLVAKPRQISETTRFYITCAKTRFVRYHLSFTA